MVKDFFEVFYFTLHKWVDTEDGLSSSRRY